MGWEWENVCGRVAHLHADINGTGTNDPVSQVVRLEDKNGDGVMDHKTIFAKDLLLPRMILPLLDSVLIAESNTNDIFEYFDRDNDGVAEEKKIWFEGGKRGGNVEHQPSGLIWSMDNWLYLTYSDYRLRLHNGKVIKGVTKGNRGQWGLTQDNAGKVMYVDAGAGSGRRSRSGCLSSAEILWPARCRHLWPCASCFHSRSAADNRFFLSTA